MRRLRRIAIAGAVLLGLGMLGLMCGRVAERGRYAVPYSTYGSGPEGARALYLLAEARGDRPMRWSRDLAALPDEGVLVALGGCELPMARPVSRYERDVLERWIDGGGVLLVAGAHEFLWPELGVHMWRPPGECDPDIGIVGELARAEMGERDASLPPPPDGGVRQPTLDDFQAELEQDPIGVMEELAQTEELPAPIWATPAAPPLEGIELVPLRQPASVVPGKDSRASTILTLPSGPAGVVVRRGEGAIVALASASVLQNREIASGEGGVLFARLIDALAPRGPVMFDEYHLGVGERRSITQYLRGVGGGAAALQVLLVIGLVLWRRGTRFGQPRSDLPAVPAGTASYVAAIGTLYAKSKDAAGAVSLLARHALQRVADHHHLPSSDPEAAAKALEERHREDEARAVRALGAIAKSPDTDGRSLVSRAKEIDDLVRSATKK